LSLLERKPQGLRSRVQRSKVQGLHPIAHGSGRRPDGIRGNGLASRAHGLRPTLERMCDTISICNPITPYPLHSDFRIPNSKFKSLCPPSFQSKIRNPISQIERPAPRNSQRATRNAYHTSNSALILNTFVAGKFRISSTPEFSAICFRFFSISSMDGAMKVNHTL